MIEECLNVYPSKRPTCRQLLEKPSLASYKKKEPEGINKICEPFQVFTLHELYHWWQLAGGDVFQELKKQGLIRSSPPILSVPRYCTFHLKVCFVIEVF